MWVMHPDGGFYSAVEDKRDPNVLVVRTRARKDAVALAKMVRVRKVKVISDEGTDYPFRVRVTRREWADVLVEFSERIDYTNFKDAVKARQGSHRAGVYSRIWGALLDLEGRARRRRGRASWLFDPADVFPDG